MTIKAFGKKFGLSEKETWDKLLDFGYFSRSSGSPKSKFIALGLFDANCNIRDPSTLAEEFSSKLGISLDDDVDQDLYTYDDLLDIIDCSESQFTDIMIKAGYFTDEGEWTKKSKVKLLNKDEMITKQGLLTIKELIQSQAKDDSFKIESEIEKDFDIDALVNSINSFVFENKSDISNIVKSLLDRLVNFDSEEEKYGNKPGVFKGWTISEPDGGLVYAKKGKQILKTTIKGNIRTLINKEDTD